VLTSDEALKEHIEKEKKEEATVSRKET